MRLFKNRSDAANELARDLAFLKEEQPLVLGIPNGGLQIAAIVAESLDAPLDILLIHKLHAPDDSEQIVGAVDEHGRISMIQSASRWHHLTTKEMIPAARSAFKVLQTRRARFRAILPETDVRGRTVLIIDHGIETGATMLAAIASVRDRGARKVIVAAPAGMSKATWQLHDNADAVVIPHVPSKFRGINYFYKVFEDIPDSVVASILQRWAFSKPDQHAGVKTFILRIKNARQQELHCELDLPPGVTRGSGPYPAVIFTHDLQSDAKSQRSVPISRRLAKRGVIGVRMDFSGHGRSDGDCEDVTLPQMIEDLRAIYEFVQTLDELDENSIGLNGAGNGGLVALCHAANDSLIKAMVLRGPVIGNRHKEARRVTAPTLIIHAERDTVLTDSVAQLDHEFNVTHQLLQIPDSTRLFHDPISRELMVSASVDWLVKHLSAKKSSVNSRFEPPQQDAASIHKSE